MRLVAARAPRRQSITEPPAQSLTAGQIRAEAAESSVDGNRAAVVGVMDVGAIVIAVAIAADVALAVAMIVSTVSVVDRGAPVVGPAMDTEAASAGDRNGQPRLRRRYKPRSGHGLGGRNCGDADGEDNRKKSMHVSVTRYSVTRCASVSQE